MTNGWPAPASRELGANWVEVTVWERVKRRFNQRRNDLKTWPATTRRFRSGSDDEHARDFQVGVAFPNLRGAAGVGQPFESLPIVDCRLPIQTNIVTIGKIDNRKLEMRYVL